jgi:hypothetical protein
MPASYELTQALLAKTAKNRGDGLLNSMCALGSMSQIIGQIYK